MHKQPADADGAVAEPGGRDSVRDTVADYCLPSERNVSGPERRVRGILGVGIGGFAVVGALAATRPVVGATLAFALLGAAAYLLATAKTRKCPVTHIARNRRG
jgi:hypothetical protein